MAGKIRIRAQLDGDTCEVKALMRHPMETGLRKNQAGDAIPAHYIEEVTVTHKIRWSCTAIGALRYLPTPFSACALLVVRRGIP